MNHADRAIAQARETLATYQAHVAKHPHLPEFSWQDEASDMNHLRSLSDDEAAALERFYLLQVRARDAADTLRVYNLPA